MKLFDFKKQGEPKEEKILKKTPKEWYDHFEYDLCYEDIRDGVNGSEFFTKIKILEEEFVDYLKSGKLKVWTELVNEDDYSISMNLEQVNRFMGRIAYVPYRVHRKAFDEKIESGDLYYYG